LAKVVQYPTSPDQRAVLARQVAMWGRAAEGIPDPDDAGDVARRIADFDAKMDQHARGVAIPLGMVQRESH
jgi:hypothetical protein